MKLEQQVVSLELAKQLKELGVKQDSLFYWQKQKTWLVHQFKPDREEVYSAFSVAELGEMLPRGYISYKPWKGWSVMFHKAESSKEWRNIDETMAETEADARAKMLIWLIENKYLSFKQTPQKEDK